MASGSRVRILGGSRIHFCCFFVVCKWNLFVVSKASQHVTIGKRSFDLLRPFWVKCMKERNVFCCIYHVEFQELLQGLNYMRLQSGIHFVGTCTTCNCHEVCTAPSSNGTGCHGKTMTYSGTTALWESVVCPKDEFDQWHSRDCL